MRKISGGWDRAKRTAQFETLIQFLAQCKNISQIKAVLETLVTSSERAAVAQRLVIIRLLQKGTSYSDIKLKLSVSPNTITKTLDLYHKHGEHNAIFNKLLKNFIFEAMMPKIKSTVFDPQNNSLGGGFRQFMREAKKK
ncbi:hypothetical protein COT12_00590 [Candidatus Berkelbacteria bacterium CG08_land_8_20_14_0_20_39_8]|uniref:TrpR like protein, YerC/YecD n=1 Tax=Candidatus Berkelbacteria bacterium CG08_land_8_20_14_0_20_39_8 TaxID=1974511 RepID=A0A2M6YCU9_9BACT|nr:MAG: hypothetical protein COT12_00590 [Candidatus Berkelbacteria bacterium CG08_land_8_20_14_0_20_39_8]